MKIIKLPFKEVVYVQSIDSKEDFVFVGDIGGTNSNFGILQIPVKQLLIFQLFFLII